MLFFTVELEFAVTLVVQFTIKVLIRCRIYTDSENIDCTQSVWATISNLERWVGTAVVSS